MINKKIPPLSGIFFNVNVQVIVTFYAYLFTVLS